MTPWSWETVRSNKRPYLAARGRHEFPQLFCGHPTPDHRCSNRLRMRQFNLVPHTLFWLASKVPLATAGCYGSPACKHRNDPKQIQPGQIAHGQARMLEKPARPKIRLCDIVVGLQRMRDSANG